VTALIGGLVEGAVSRAQSAEEVACLVAQTDVIVLDAESAWAVDLVRTIPVDARPAVLAVGVAAPPPDVADEWLRALDASEASARVQLAIARGRARRRGLKRAFVDPLTSLPNRRAAVRGLVREAARARRTNGGAVSLVLVDLDEFKQVNEREGHLAGDRLLRRVGHQLARATRSHELVARIGGDEFALVIAGGLAEADRAAERVEQALANIGVPATVAAVELAAGERLLDLYRRADELLRDEKSARREERSQVRAKKPGPSRSTGKS
jgi:diguanylate cyclase (GGDEF)-like protein